MNADVLLVVITVLVALIFDFINGFHDAANSIATVVSTRVLSPKLAVAVGGGIQLPGCVFSGHRCRQDHRPRHDSARCRRSIRRAGRVVRRHYLGSADVVVGPAHFLVARVDGWICRRRHDARGIFIRMAFGSSVIIAAGWYKTLIFIVVAPIMGLVMGFIVHGRHLLAAAAQSAATG